MPKAAHAFIWLSWQVDTEHMDHTSRHPGNGAQRKYEGDAAASNKSKETDLKRMSDMIGELQRSLRAMQQARAEDTAMMRAMMQSRAEDAAIMRNMMHEIRSILRGTVVDRDRMDVDDDSQEHEA